MYNPKKWELEWIWFTEFENSNNHFFDIGDHIRIYHWTSPEDHWTIDIIINEESHIQDIYPKSKDDIKQLISLFIWND